MFASWLRSAMRRRDEGADLSKALRLPGWLDAPLGHDRVAYPIHLLLGILLERVGAPPVVTGQEWLKAAAHGCTDGALSHVAQRLAATRRRSIPEEIDDRLRAALVRRLTCHRRDVVMRRRQLTVLEWSGIVVEGGHDVFGPAGEVPGCPHRLKARRRGTGTTDSSPEREVGGERQVVGAAARANPGPRGDQVGRVEDVVDADERQR